VTIASFNSGDHTVKAAGKAECALVPPPGPTCTYTAVSPPGYPLDAQGSLEVRRVPFPWAAIGSDENCRLRCLADPNTLAYVSQTNIHCWCYTSGEVDFSEPLWSGSFGHAQPAPVWDDWASRPSVTIASFNSGDHTVKAAGKAVCTTGAESSFEESPNCCSCTALDGHYLPTLFDGNIHGGKPYTEEFCRNKCTSDTSCTSYRFWAGDGNCFTYSGIGRSEGCAEYSDNIDYRFTCWKKHD